MKKGRKPLKPESHLELAIHSHLLAYSLFNGYPPPERNQRCYLPPTRLELDFAWPDYKVAIEIHGGIDKRGRRSGHTSRDGLRRDYYKCNLAQTKGWILLQFPPEYCTCPNHWRIAKRLLNEAFKQSKARP